MRCSVRRSGVFFGLMAWMPLATCIGGCSGSSGDTGDDDDSEVGCVSTAPVTTIQAPAMDAVFKPGGDVSLVGTVLDAEESDPSLLAVTWTINGTRTPGGTIDPIVVNATASSNGTVETTVDELAEGNYTASLRATDSCELTAQTEVSFRVYNAAPTVAISSVSQTQVKQNGKVTFMGTSSDGDDAADTLTITLVDDMERQQNVSTKPDAAGNWSLEFTFTAPGVHSVAAASIDPGNKSGISDPVEISVQLPLP